MLNFYLQFILQNKQFVHYYQTKLSGLCFSKYGVKFSFMCLIQLSKKNIQHATISTVNVTYFLHFSQLYILSPANRNIWLLPLKSTKDYFLLVLQSFATY